MLEVAGVGCRRRSNLKCGRGGGGRRRKVEGGKSHQTQELGGNFTCLDENLGPLTTHAKF